MTCIVSHRVFYGVSLDMKSRCSKLIRMKMQKEIKFQTLIVWLTDTFMKTDVSTAKRI